MANGTYPGVLNNSTVDGSFGIASPLFITPYTVGGSNAAPSFTPKAPINITTLTGVSTSFPSKSEGALNLSPSKTNLTLVDYLAAPNTLDVSNSTRPASPSPATIRPAQRRERS